MIKNDFNYLRTSCCSLSLGKANVTRNVEEILKAVKAAVENGVSLLVLPPMAITSPFCGNLFFQNHLYNMQYAGIKSIADATRDKDITVMLNYYEKSGGKYINSLCVIQNGKISDSISIRDFDADLSEYFVDSDHNRCHKSRFIDFDRDISIGMNDDCDIQVIFDTAPYKIGKKDYYESLAKIKSGENCNVILFSGSDGILIIAGAGEILSSAYPFDENADDNGRKIVYDVDLDLTAYKKAKNRAMKPTESYNDIEILQLAFPDGDKLYRKISQYPFLPDSQEKSYRNCEEIFNIQVQKLAERIAYTNSKTSVLGISGGLDSTLALLTTVYAHDKLGKPLTDVIAITMPGFGTTDRTYQNALQMMNSLGVTSREISIVNAVKQHFSDIDHPADVHDITYENAQARERTQILMDVANRERGIVIGTGDLSEIALGWCTYNGDHMSMYGSNAGVPKTVIQEVIRWFAEEKISKSEFIQDSKVLKKALLDILSTPISPELLPPDSQGNMNQKTEDKVGPYALHDFFIYHTIRNGATPRKVLFLAKIAFDGIFDEDTIRKWLKIFYKRFFGQQFKRTCSPDSTAVGSVDLSNANWTMASDTFGDEWIDEME